MGYDHVLSELWGDSSEEESPSLVQWNSMKMAQYFDKKMRQAPWNFGFTMTNMQALASQLKKWKTDGKTEEEVRALIDFYMVSAEARGYEPGWKDFLSRAAANAKLLATRTTKTPLEKAREIGTYEAFLEALKAPQIAQRYYDKYKEEHGQG